jgi:ketosteroid isomerase-like protein
MSPSDFEEGDMRKRILIVPLIFLLGLAPACQKQGRGIGWEHEADVGADVTAIKKLIGEFFRLYNDRNFDKLMSAFYAENAILMSPNVPMRKGKEAILAAYLEDDKRNDEHIETSVVEDVHVSGNLAVARGEDTGTTTPRSGGEPVPYSLKWLMAFARQGDGTWKCIDEMWNDNR